MAMNKTAAVVERGHELLGQLIYYQNTRDGVDRPGLFVIDKSKTLDQFAMDVSEVATYLSSLQKLIPMQSELSEIGRKLEAQGKITVTAGDSYAESALMYIKTTL